jgi:tetratricopeptide (TPR) repeat protein
MAERNQDRSAAASPRDPELAANGARSQFPRREYATRLRLRKDVDQAARAVILKKLVLALPGGVIGALAGWFVGFGIVPGFLAGSLVVYLITSGFVAGAASLMGKIHNPSADSTPRRREYSRAETLTVRGNYDQAIEAYEVALSESPEDPEPYIRIARIYRDELLRYDEALFWFKRARSDASIDRGRELLVTQEIIEIHSRRLGAPRRAIPELARLIDRFPGDPITDWAKREMSRLRREMAEEELGDLSL